jgi:hypothetical protein
MSRQLTIAALIVTALVAFGQVHNGRRSRRQIMPALCPRCSHQKSFVSSAA